MSRERFRGLGVQKPGFFGSWPCRGVQKPGFLTKFPVYYEKSPQKPGFFDYNPVSALSTGRTFSIIPMITPNFAFVKGLAKIFLGGSERGNHGGFAPTGLILLPNFQMFAVASGDDTLTIWTEN